MNFSVKPASVEQAKKVLDEAKVTYTVKNKIIDVICEDDALMFKLWGLIEFPNPVNEVMEVA